MASLRHFSELPNFKKALSDKVADADLIADFQAAMDVTVTVFSASDRAYMSEVKSAEQTLESIKDVVWERQIVQPYISSGNADAASIKVVDRLKYATGTQIERSLKALSDSGLSTKLVRDAWNVMKEFEGLYWRVVDSGHHAKRGSPPDLLSRGLGTCSCCFGEFHVRNEKVVRHGQRKLHQYNWSATCQGVGEPPLEISTIGLEKLITKTEKWIETIEAELSDPSTITSVFVVKAGSPETLMRDDPGFEKALAAYTKRLPGILSDHKSDLEVLKERLTHWSEKLEQRAGIKP